MGIKDICNEFYLNEMTEGVESVMVIGVENGIGKLCSNSDCLSFPSA